MGKRIEGGQKNRRRANKKRHQVGSALPSRDRQSCRFLGWRLQKKITTGGTNKIMGFAYLQKSLRGFAGLLLSPELAKSTCGLCEFVQCAQLSLVRAVDLRIFSVSAVANVEVRLFLC